MKYVTPIDDLISKYMYEESFNITKAMVNTRYEPVKPVLIVDCHISCDL
jgi:hypothetical protein